MALNFGAALGAAAKSGMDTYMSLEENERRQKELKFREDEAKWQEEQRNQERKLNEITGQTFGAGDTRTVTDPATVTQAGDYEGLTAIPAPAQREIAYTPQQKMADFKQRALAAGVPLRKVTETAGAHRAEKYAENEELALGFSQQVMDGIKASPNDLEPVVKKYFQTPYNEGKAPELNDGKTMDIVPTDSGKAMVFKDAKGNPIRSVPLTIDNVEKMTRGWQEQMLRSSNPANFWKSRDADLKEREVAAKEGELGVHKEFYGRGGTYERVAGLRAGGTGEKSIKAKAGEYAEALLDAKAINPATKQPYTAEEAKQYALGVVLKDPNAKTKADWTMSADGSFRSNSQGVVQDFDPKTNTWRTRGVPPVSENAAKYNIIADVRDGQVGYRGKDKWYTSEQEAVDSFTNTASGAAAATGAKTALPTGTRAELRASTDKINEEIAALRKSVTARTPIEQRAAIGKQIDALQMQRSDTLKAWAKTPGMAIDTEAAFPMPRP